MNPLITIRVAIGGYLIGSISFARLIGHRTDPDNDFGLEKLEWRAIVVGYLIGLLVFRDVLLAHHAGSLLLSPVWFALLGQRGLVIDAIVVSIIRWSASNPELRTYWTYRREGEFHTREFHDVINQTHMGYVHRYLRR